MNKTEIISEIRRIASELAAQGKPLGKAKFESMSGIKFHDWYPHFWVRWGDALKEAGYTANAFQVRIEDEALIPFYALLIRDLGHWPVTGEVRKRCEDDSAFPSHSVMGFARLGGKSELARMLVAFCEANSGWNDVREIAEKQVEDRIQPIEDRSNRTDDQIDGHVYLIKSGKHYKIGKTNDLGRRGKEIALELPEASSVIHSIQTDDPSGIESYWHRRFNDRRKNGEWFELSAADVRAFRRRKFM